ncbi:exported hypothetical protein [Candidatus Zixiibacteriota bacterium]|nr:exported hypothetical protein [candidate division Zixibacteria bacterium]
MNKIIMVCVFCCIFCANASGKKDEAAELHKKGLQYIEKEQYQQAVETFKKVVAIKPDDAKAYNNLALAYCNLVRYQEAIDACLAAIRIDPTLPEPHCYLGIGYLGLERFQEAATACEESIRLKPGFVLAHKTLAMIYEKLGRADEAKKHIPGLLMTGPFGVLNEKHGENWYVIDCGRSAIIIDKEIKAKLDRQGSLELMPGEHSVLIKDGSRTIHLVIESGRAYQLLRIMPLGMEQYSNMVNYCIEVHDPDIRTGNGGTRLDCPWNQNR